MNNVLFVEGDLLSKDDEAYLNNQKRHQQIEFLIRRYYDGPSRQHERLGQYLTNRLRWIRTDMEDSSILFYTGNTPDKVYELLGDIIWK